MVKFETYDYDVTIGGSPYKCKAIWRSNFSPNTAINCQSQGDPFIFNASKYTSLKIPLKSRRIATEQLLIKSGKIKVKTFAIHKASPISANPPSQEWIENVTKNIFDDLDVG